MNYMEKIADALSRAINRGLVHGTPNIRRAAQGQSSRTVKTIGQGLEGIAQMRTHGEFGVEVAKIYDKKSPFYSDTSFSHKGRIFKEMEHKIPGGYSARLHGEDPSKKIHFLEYVPGSKKDYAHPDGVNIVKDVLKIEDVHGTLPDKPAHNMIGGRIIDFLPSSPSIKRTYPIGKADIQLDNVRTFMHTLDSRDPADAVRLQKAIARKEAIKSKIKDMKSEIRTEVDTNPKGRIDRVLRQTYGTR